MDVMDLLKGQLSDGLLDQLSQQIGGANQQQTTTAASTILSTLMGAIAKNAASEKGASALSNALERDHDGSIFEDVTGFLTGNKQASNSKMMNGAGILKHILGDRQSGAIDMISQTSGLNSSQTGGLMASLAPLVMGALGKAKKDQGLNLDGLTSMLGGVLGAQKQQKAQNPAMGMVMNFLDKDGDGSIVDDAIGMLGKLFSKR